MALYIRIRELILNRRALLVTNVAFAGIILLLILVIIRDFFTLGAPGTLETHAIPGGQAQKRETVRLQDYEIVLKNNPFGFDGGSLNALSRGGVNKQTARVSPSKFKLIGTIAAGEKDSFAILIGADGKQELYRVKADIPGLGSLVRVEPYRVIVKGDGEFEILLDEVKMKQAGSERETIRPFSRSTTEQSTPPSDEQFVEQTAEGAYNLNAKMVQESINNPQRLMTDARLVPIYKDGEQEGFKLSEVKKGGIYDSLGLQNGDVLMRINEYNITNPEAALQAFTALRGVERLQLDVMRNNSKVTLTYTIK